MTNPAVPEDQRDLKAERWELLEHIDTLTDKPMIALSCVWLVLLIIAVTTGLNPLLQTISYVIWALFAVDFAIEFMIAPYKGAYLRQNWLTAISLLLPAVRVLRIFSAFSFAQAALSTRSLSVLRVVASLNRSMRSVRELLGRRGIGYVIALTVIVACTGAVGMYLLESPAALRQAGYGAAARQGAGLLSYGDAVWWTAMIMSTVGSAYWPMTVAGRILGWLLAVYGFLVFGYLTATIASYFVMQDATQRLPTGATNPAANETTVLRAEIAALREQIDVLLVRLD